MSFFPKGILGSADKITGGTHMYIQSYQIHNVLNAYRKQLSQGKARPTQQPGTHDTRSDSVRISSEANSPSIMEKVAANVLKKITNVAHQSNFEQAMIKQVQIAKTDLHRRQKDNTFTFNIIEADNHKETRFIAVGNSQGLMNRLDELAKAAVNRLGE
jgi:hypothetical protein